MAEIAWTETLLTGLAQLLDTEGVGTWRPDDTYEDSDGEIQPAIVLIDLPTEPEQVICLTDYPLEDQPGGADAIVGIQVRIRGTRDPMVALRLRDQVYRAFHGRRNLTFDPVDPDTGEQVRIAQIYRNSATPIGPDGQGRQERSENYYAQVTRAYADID